MLRQPDRDTGSFRYRRHKEEACKMQETENKPTCNHYDHPPGMMVFGDYYQARCSGCGTAGPIATEGPWGARQALYSVVVHAG